MLHAPAARGPGSYLEPVSQCCQCERAGERHHVGILEFLLVLCVDCVVDVARGDRRGLPIARTRFGTLAASKNEPPLLYGDSRWQGTTQAVARSSSRSNCGSRVLSSTALLRSVWRLGGRPLDTVSRFKVDLLVERGQAGQRRRKQLLHVRSVHGNDRAADELLKLARVKVPHLGRNVHWLLLEWRTRLPSLDGVRLALSSSSFARSQATLELNDSRRFVAISGFFFSMRSRESFFFH